MTQITAEKIRELVEAERDWSRAWPHAVAGDVADAQGICNIADNCRKSATKTNSALDALARQEKERAEGLSDEAIWDVVAESTPLGFRNNYPREIRFKPERFIRVVRAIIARVAPSTPTETEK
jgi:hypothetical protein